jgi:hypothetical protein
MNAKDINRMRFIAGVLLASMSEEQLPISVQKVHPKSSDATKLNEEKEVYDKRERGVPLRRGTVLGFGACAR